MAGTRLKNVAGSPTEKQGLDNLTSLEKKNLVKFLENENLIDFQNGKIIVTDKGYTVRNMLTFLNIGAWKDNDISIATPLIRILDKCGVFKYLKGKENKAKVEKRLAYVFEQMGYNPSLAQQAAKEVLRHTDVLELLQSATVETFNQQTGKKEGLQASDKLRDAIKTAQAIGLDIYSTSFFTRGLTIPMLLQKIRSIEKSHDALTKKAVEVMLNREYGSHEDLRIIATKLGVKISKSANTLQIFEAILTKITTDSKFKEALANWKYGTEIFEHMDIITEYVFVTRVVPVLKQRLSGKDVDTEMNKIINELSKQDFHSQYFAIMFLKLTERSGKGQSSTCMLNFIDPEQFPAVCSLMENACNGIISRRPWDAPEQMFEYGSQINRMMFLSFKKMIIAYLNGLLKYPSNTNVTGPSRVAVGEAIKEVSAKNYKTKTAVEEMREIIGAVAILMQDAHANNPSVLGTNMYALLKDPDRFINELAEEARKRKIDILSLEKNNPFLSAVLTVNPNYFATIANEMLPPTLAYSGEWERAMFNLYGTGTYFSCGNTKERYTTFTATLEMNGVGNSMYNEVQIQQFNNVSNTFFFSQGTAQLTNEQAKWLAQLYHGETGQSGYLGMGDEDLNQSWVVRLKKDGDHWALSFWQYTGKVNGKPTYFQVNTYQLTDEQAKKIWGVFGKYVGGAGGASIAATSDKLQGGVIFLKLNKGWQGAVIGNAKEGDTPESASAILMKALSLSSYTIYRLYGDKNTIQAITRASGTSSQYVYAAGEENKQLVGGAMYIKRKEGVTMGWYGLRDLNAGSQYGIVWKRTDAYLGLNVEYYERKMNGSAVAHISYDGGSVDFGASTLERRLLYTYNGEMPLYFGGEDMMLTIEELKAVGKRMQELSENATETNMQEYLYLAKIEMQGWNVISELLRNRFNAYFCIATNDSSWKTLIDKKGYFTSVLNFPVGKNVSLACGVGGKVNNIGAFVRWLNVSQNVENQLASFGITAALVDGGKQGLLLGTHYNQDKTGEESVLIGGAGLGEIDSIFGGYGKRTTTQSKNKNIQTSDTFMIVGKVMHVDTDNNYAYLGGNWSYTETDFTSGKQTQWVIIPLGIWDISRRGVGAEITGEYIQTTLNNLFSVKVFGNIEAMHLNQPTKATYYKFTIGGEGTETLSKEESEKITHGIVNIFALPNKGIAWLDKHL